MKAVVEVTPVVKAGLGKGGEDLFLDFTCTVDGDAVPTEFEVQLDLDDDTDGYNVEVLDEDAEEDYAENGVPYVGRVRYETWHYEFVWEGDAQNARKLIEEHLKDNKNWRFCHHPGETPKLHFSHRHYVAGNAD